MWGMNHSSYFSWFIKSSVVFPPCLTGLLCVGKVIHRGIPTTGSNTETELWPQQQSPNLHECLRETESQVSIATNVIQPKQHHQAKSTPKLHHHVLPAQCLLNRARSVGERSAPSASNASACSSGPELPKSGLAGFFLCWLQLAQGQPFPNSLFPPQLALDPQETPSPGQSRGAGMATCKQDLNGNTESQLWEMVWHHTRGGKRRWILNSQRDLQEICEAKVEKNKEPANKNCSLSLQYSK